MTTTTFPPHSPAGLGTRQLPLRRAMDLLQEWRARSAGRAALSQMSAAELQDLGLSVEQAEWEANKAPWRA